jgi:hypothetical protein
MWSNATPYVAHLLRLFIPLLLIPLVELCLKYHN